MENKLNSCPFCGSPEVSLHKGGGWADGYVCWVECDTCESCGPTTNLGKDIKFLKKKASELWNTRTTLSIKGFDNYNKKFTIEEYYRIKKENCNE